MPRPRLATLVLFVVAVAVAGTVNPVAAAATSRHHRPPLLDCGPAPILSKNEDAAFRADLASALAALPSAAAARRDAFAAVHAGRAFARGACFAANVPSSPRTTHACEACLAAASRDVTSVCLTSGRAGVWRNECFLSYAASNASSSLEDAFRGWFYDGTSTTTALADGGECLADRAVDCDRCWDESARAAARIGWWDKIHGEEVRVVGYSCLLRVRVSTLPNDGTVVDLTWLDFLVGCTLGTLGSLFIHIVQIVRALPPQVNNNG